MRLLFVPIFAVLFFMVLTIVVQADQQAVPPPLTLLETFAPQLPKQDQVEEVPTIIRGQSRSVAELAAILDSPPPIPRGPVEEDVIDPKLTGISESTESDLDEYAKEMEKISAKVGGAGKNTEATDPLGNSILLAATGVLTMVLVYMAFVAYDYRQRWMQSLTAQNDRYLGGGMFDMETEDYGGGSVSFSEGFGLPHHSI
jgi:hypothetical protein